MMIRFLFLSLLSLSIFLPLPAFAQDIVPLRGSARDDYARLVFGWEEDVSYTIDQSQAGQAIISFSKTAKLKNDLAEIRALANVGAVEVLSAKPLKLSITIPKSSKIRGFKIGTRVVFDVYNPTDKADLKALDVSAVSKPVVKKVEEAAHEKPAVKEQKLEHKEDHKEASHTVKSEPSLTAAARKSDLPAVPPAIVLVPENLQKRNVHQEAVKQAVEPHQATHNKEELEEVLRDDHYIVSFRGTLSMPMAIYEERGVLFFAYDAAGSFVTPNMTGKGDITIEDFYAIESEHATVYSLILPDEKFFIKATGGGLVWDVAIGDKVNESEGLELERIVRNAKKLRSGKVIWPLTGRNKIIDFVDPVTGQDLKIVLAGSSNVVGGAFQSFSDFDVLKSPLGFVIRPKVDNLKVELTEKGLEISRPQGLSLSLPKDAEAARLFIAQNKSLQAEDHDDSHNGDGQNSHEEKGHHDEKPKKHSNALFKFGAWQLGPESNLNRQENVLLAGTHDKDQARRVEDLLTLGKMMLSHARGAEALGYLEYARSELAGLDESPEFKALRGVAHALDWKSEAALADLSHPALENQDEVKLWKAYVLADLGDWNQAAAVLPDQHKVIYDYPYVIGHRLALEIAEVYLRDGKVDKAEDLLHLVGRKKKEMAAPMMAAYKYLLGEADRQKGDEDSTLERWTELTEDPDALYRTKAGLALTILLAKQDKIDNKETVNRLERLRYAWRGDELEANVNYWLGTAYFKEDKFIKGLSIMRDAATFSDNSVLAQRITGDMAKTFTDLFLGPKLKDVSAVDAVALYEQFSELTPVGDDGDKLVQMLAEHLVRADLLSRATRLLQYQVDHRLKGKEKLRVAIRLAAIELIDKNPQKALDALVKAEQTMTFLSDTDEKSNSRREVDLLRIRAYSQNKEFDKALALLEKIPDSRNVSRLRADISWQAGYWDEAAESLNTVIVDENISPTRPLTKDQADLILNRAIALNLDNDRIALASMRQKYSDLMLQSERSNQFEVITRQRGSSGLADRETLMSVVAEVDLFREFLDTYKNTSP